ncbi:MAG TPA: sulfite exporter TauE/SafE family protein [Alphaproteobacteria bacterium]|jgi:uncharacterized membrane protein YfcA
MVLAVPEFWFLVPTLMALGGLTGFLAGLLGIGGGIVLVPCLYAIFSLLGYPESELMHVAIGTSHAIIAITAISSARAHWKRGGIDTVILPRLGVGIVCGVAAATFLVNDMSGTTLKLMFSLIIAVLAVLMIGGTDRFGSFKTGPHPVVHVGAGGIIGAVATFLGIGGATLSVPYMTHCRLPIRQAVGTAAALGLFIAIPAAIGFIFMGLDVPDRPPFSFGFVNLAAWVFVAPVSIFSAPWGAKAAHSLPVQRLRSVFALIMILVSANMMFDVLHD